MGFSGTRSGAGVAPAAFVLVLVLAGCSGGSSPGPDAANQVTSAPVPTASAAAPPASAPPSVPATPPPNAPAAPTVAGGRCTTAELTGALGPADGAAGSVYRALLLTNSGKRTCELTGFPGVSYVAGADGHQVGPAAAMSGDRGGPVLLAVGEAAGAQLRMVNVGNFDAAVCRPTPVLGVRVYPPGDTASLFIAAAGTGCASTPPGDQLSVQTLNHR